MNELNLTGSTRGLLHMGLGQALDNIMPVNLSNTARVSFDFGNEKEPEMQFSGMTMG